MKRKELKKIVLKFSTFPLPLVPRIFTKPSIYLSPFYQEELDFYFSSMMDLSYLNWYNKQFEEFREIDRVKWQGIYHNFFIGKKEILLPFPNSLLLKEFSLFIKRRSRRDFSGKKMSLEELSTLLYFAFNGKKIEKYKIGDEEIEIMKRSWPSGGALYPIEVWLLLQHVRGIRRGLYFYNFPYHSLSLIEDFSKKEIKKILNSLFPKGLLDIIPLENASIIIFLVGDFVKQRIKYGLRSLRYLLLESGHIAQNFYLIAEKLKLKICAIGGFFDRKVNKFLNINELSKGVIYVLAIGK